MTRVVLLFHIIIGVVLCADKYESEALGNLAVILEPEDLIVSSENMESVSSTGDLWCQAMVNQEIAELKWTKFVRPNNLSDVDVTEFTSNSTMASLHFNYTSASAAGTYICEMETVNGDFVNGLLFAFMRPILIVNDILELLILDSNGTVLKVHPIFIDANTFGATVELKCPVVGFPAPTISWFKDGKTVEANDRMFYKNNSIVIENITMEDVGKYRCIATNEFSLVVVGPKEQHILELEYLLLAPEHRPDYLLIVVCGLSGIISFSIVCIFCSFYTNYCLFVKRRSGRFYIKDENVVFEKVSRNVDSDSDSLDSACVEFITSYVVSEEKYSIAKTEKTAPGGSGNASPENKDVVIEDDKYEILV